MALYDNKYWLLTHIRNSFISTDDTGMCELVMVGEDLPRDLVETLDNYPDTDDSQGEDDIEPESYDIQLDMDFGVRNRSNTAARLEKMDLARKRAAKIKNIKWETSSEQLTQEEKDDMFIKRDIIINKKSSVIKKSLLSEQLEKCTNLPQNPFMEYTKFDGSAQLGIPIRKYKIFLTMLPEEQRNYPMIVCCIATAKIQELIGLICLKCSTAHGDFVLQSVTNYGLYITEEDGEVEGGFPCLDPKECIARFGFTCLGLVEHKNSKNVSFDTTDSETFEKAVKPRTSSAPTIDETTQQRLMEGHNTAMQAADYKSYTVYIINKMRAKVEIHLGISLDKLEIDPIHQKSSKFMLVRQKAVSHHIHCIASCDILDTKSTKCTFRVVYSLSFENFTGSMSGSGVPPLQSSASFKHYDFESDIRTAKEIVQKINHILDIRSSNSQKEYIALQERKLLRRNRSFHLK